EKILDLLRRRAWQRGDHVDHRHGDLRLLLSRYRENGEQSDSQRRDRDEGGQLRAQERLCNPSGDAHGQFPAVAATRPARTTMCSPDCNPAVTSTISPNAGPSRTQRRSSPCTVRRFTPVRSPSCTIASDGTTSTLSRPVGSVSVALLPARSAALGFGTSA